ncbi:glycosyltransferase family 2 protein [Mucilaginibacter phyllosphaerae]
MDISVIIPAYNAEATILKAIASVLNQTYKCYLEIIIVNDGSVDNTSSIVEKYCEDNSVNNIVIHNKNNGGVASARNIGMKLAKGKYIALLDADDEWIPGKLEHQIQIMHKNPSIDFLGSGRNNEELKILGKKINKLHKASVKELLIKMYPQTSTAIFKRNLFENYGGYNENLTHAEDGNLWVRYCANSNFYYSPESLVVTGGGKPHFGHSGLSANLKLMEAGAIFTLKEARQQRLISSTFFCAIFIFMKIKYTRRVLITKIRR